MPSKPEERREACELGGPRRVERVAERPERRQRGRTELLRPAPRAASRSATRCPWRSSQSAGSGAQPPPSSGTRSSPSCQARMTAAASARFAVAGSPSSPSSSPASSSSNTTSNASPSTADARASGRSEKPSPCVALAGALLPLAELRGEADRLGRRRGRRGAPARGSARRAGWRRTSRSSPGRRVGTAVAEGDERVAVDAGHRRDRRRRASAGRRACVPGARGPSRCAGARRPPGAGGGRRDLTTSIFRSSSGRTRRDELPGLGGPGTSARAAAARAARRWSTSRRAGCSTSPHRTTPFATTAVIAGVAIEAKDEATAGRVLDARVRQHGLAGHADRCAVEGHLGVVREAPRRDRGRVPAGRPRARASRGCARRADPRASASSPRGPVAARHARRERRRRAAPRARRRARGRGRR